MNTSESFNKFWKRDDNYQLRDSVDIFYAKQIWDGCKNEVSDILQELPIMNPTSTELISYIKGKINKL